MNTNIYTNVSYTHKTASAEYDAAKAAAAEKKASIEKPKTTTTAAAEYNAAKAEYTNAKQADTATSAATYKKADRTYASNANYVTLSKKNQETIARLKAHMEQRDAQFRSLVEDMLLKQGKTLSLTDNIYSMLRKGELEVTPEIQAQAKRDIAEDGYWGVEQTSERLVSFAKAISGDNAEMADKLIAAVEKGFKQATKTWGGELPDLCKKTLDATVEKLNAWKDSLNKDATDEMADTAANAFANQAGQSAAAKLF